MERQLKHNVNILKRFDNDLAARKVVEDFDKMIERRKVEDGQVFKAKSHQLHDWVKQQAIIFAHRKTENEDALKKTDQFLKKIKNGSEPPAASDIKRERSGSCSGTDPARTEVQSDKKERAESGQRSSSGSDAARKKIQFSRKLGGKNLSTALVEECFARERIRNSCRFLIESFYLLT